MTDVDPRIAAVVLLMQKQPDVEINAIARAVNLSSSRLRHLFRVQTGVPLHRHLKEQRLLRATQLLKETFLSVKQVATASGFGDVGHFAREFHKMFSLTPTAYRHAADIDNE